MIVNQRCHICGGKRGFQKKIEQIFMDVQQQQQQHGFSVVSLDESFFFYDSLVRRVWFDGNSRPIARITGSHKHSCIFCTICLGGKQLFRQHMTNSMVIHSLII